MNFKKLLILVVFSGFCVAASAQFDHYFHDRTLRIDYYHAGNAASEFYYFDEMIEEPYWGGSKTNLIDTLSYGEYFFEVVDSKTGSVIYSRGYGSLFSEWQTTDEAKQTSKSFTETVVFPFPKNDVRVDFFSRNRKGVFEKKFEYAVDVSSYFIRKERRLLFPSFDVHISGTPSKMVDILILPEGYTESEMGIFIKDCQEFSRHLFSFEPYTSNSHKFNIRGVLAPSPESGCDIPADSIWRKTLLGAGFYTFDSERYCMTPDNKSVRDMAANAPYDQIYILVNNPKYGGGAIYNYYSLSVNSNSSAAKIFIHEFGHGFAGLADEYYNSEVAYSDFYPTDVEPWEPNITTLIDFDRKWKKMISPDIPVPTPATGQYEGITGVFEGGGYAAKGVYRPRMDCLMNTFKGDTFCDVCKTAIQRMIDFYTN
ncbi:MAG TPA: M64 family metallopeptidase [Bacteroidales bacterium]|nr:M64 family metallopeptidase [Bacteroidales bacterium]